MAYTTINKSTDYFNTKLYTGNNGTQSITGVGHQPDLIWVKARNDTANHTLTDAVRGTNSVLYSNQTQAPDTPTNAITSFNSDGFSVGSNGSFNANSINYASWNWKANGAGSANTDGDINSTVSVNQTAGFSIVKYTGNGSNDQRIGHGLGARPVTWFIKNLSRAEDWIVYHQGIATNWYDDTYLYLNANNQAMGAVNAGTGNPTSSVFYIGNSDKTGKSGDDYIAYVFAEKTGYSKFGSYTGNGNANGPFIYTGFKPAFVIIKNSSNAHNWTMIDDKRLGYNDKNYVLFPDLNNSEPTTSESDIVSNGFKVRASANGVNQSGNTMIYMAFGQSLVGSNNVPCNAR